MYAKYAPYQFLAYWHELWREYEALVGPFEHLAPESYARLTGQTVSLCLTSSKTFCQRRTLSPSRALHLRILNTFAHLVLLSVLHSTLPLVHIHSHFCTSITVVLAMLSSLALSAFVSSKPLLSLHVDRMCIIGLHQCVLDLHAW